MDDVFVPQDLRSVTSERKRELLKQLIMQRGAAGALPISPAGSTRRPSGPLPLSFSQERMFFLHSLDSSGSLYNVPVQYRVHAAVDCSALARSLTRLVARHESLRTGFALTTTGPVQEIHPIRPISLRVVNSSTADLSDSGLGREIRDEIRRPFDLAQPPLLRVVVFQIAPEESVLLLLMHHIVSDRRSIQILTQELFGLYVAEVQGRETALPDLPLQPADIALRGRQYLTSERLESLLDFWRNELRGAPVLQLPADVSSDPVGARSGKQCTVTISVESAARLKKMAADLGATLFMTLLAAFSEFLGSFAGESDFVIGIPVSERRLPEAQNLIGLFVNTLPIRVRRVPGETFRDLVSRVRETCLAAYQHGEAPFDRIVNALELPRGAGQSPLTRVMFQLDTLPARDSVVAQVEAENADWGTGRFDWDVSVTENAAGALRIDLEYRTDRFHDDAMSARLDAFAGMLQVLTPDSTLPHNAITDTASIRTTLHRLFQEQARHAPDAIALECDSERITYGLLDRASSRVAQTIQAAGIEPGSCVGVIAEPALETVAAILGILKSGNAYVPLDADYPPARLRFIAQDASLRLILSPRPCDLGIDVQVLHVDNPVDSADAPDFQSDTCHDADAVACVMYTSGTTGAPKGVLVTHQGIARLFFDQSYASFSPRETFLQMAPLSFDASTFELWGALLHGGRCVLETGRVHGPAELERILRDRGVTTAWLTASLFNIVVDQDAGVLRPLRQLLIGGEPLSVPHVRKALAALPDTRIINGYGPTETAVFACCYRIPGELPDSCNSIPIGREIAHTTAFVMDENGSSVPPGASGELWIGGPGVARGYLNQPELTAGKFVLHRAPQGMVRAFRTGDKVRRRHDGLLEFLGRLDHQVKIRGFRVEPEEIESVMCRHPAVKAACVAGGQASGEPDRLIAWFSPVGETPDIAGIRRFLADRLPPYMVPSVLVPLEALPLTSSGKLDRNGLSEKRRRNRDFPKEHHPQTAESELPEAVKTLCDPVEVRLAHIWSDILRVRDISFDQDFFLAGGNSLDALRLLARIRAEFGRDLTVESIFSAPTIQLQARLLRGESTQKRAMWIVRAGSGGPPLFCVGANPLWLNVAGRLSSQRSVIGIGFDNPERLSGPEPISAMAGVLIETIRECQPEGPYTLAGWCISGLLAFEAARQLRNAGEVVDLVVMVDTFPPFPLRGLSWMSRLITWIRMEIAGAWFHIRRISRSRGPGRIAGAWDNLKGLWSRVGDVLGLRESQIPSDLHGPGIRLPEDHTAFWQRVTSASYRYNAKPYSGDILFCTPMDRPPGRDWRFAAIWQKLTLGRFEELVLPGDHRTLFDNPAIQQLADRLDRR